MEKKQFIYSNHDDENFVMMIKRPFANFFVAQKMGCGDDHILWEEPPAGKEFVFPIIYTNSGDLCVNEDVKNILKKYFPIPFRGSETEISSHSFTVSYKNSRWNYYKLFYPTYEIDKKQCGNSEFMKQFVLNKNKFNKIPLENRYLFKIKRPSEILCHKTIKDALENHSQDVIFKSVRDYFIGF